MKTVQEWLCEVDEKDLADIYWWNYPPDVQMMPDIDLTWTEIHRRLREQFLAFVYRLQNLALSPIEKEEMMVFFGCTKHRTADGMDTCVRLLSLCDLRKQGEPELVGYTWTLTSHATCMGYYLADTDCTKENILDVLAEILHYLSFFGYEQEEQDERHAHIQKSLEACGDAPSDKGPFLSEAEYDEKCGRKPKTPDPQAEQLQWNIIHAEVEYSNHCIRKELVHVRKLLPSEKE